MSVRASPPAAVAFAAALASACVLAPLVASPARAGSLNVRDTDGGQWMVGEDPIPDAPDFVLRRFAPDGSADPRFGRAGLSAFSISTTNDPPVSVRVDSLRRIWMVGASIAGNLPQPVVERFLPAGALDLRWGVQGKVQLSPDGMAVKPNDLLPLSDGSVLVAGEIAGQAAPRAVVFRLKADGALDMAFGTAGLWQRAGSSDASTATSLAASGDGTVAVAVAVRGAKPAAELWSLNDRPPKMIQQKPLDDSTDGEDLRTAWSGDHWALNTSGGPTGLVPPALLTNRPAAGPVVAAAPTASAASDPGQGGFNPFGADAASAPSAAADADDGLPWNWISNTAIVLAAVAGTLFARSRRARARAEGKIVAKPGQRR